MYKAEEKLNLVRGKRTSEESKNDSNILKYLPVPSAQAEKADIKAPVTKRRGTLEGDGLPIREENKRYYVYRSQNARELENAEKDFTNKNRAYTQVSALAKRSISDAENLKKDYESCLKSYNENPTDETYNKYSEAVDKYNSTAELANYYSELMNKAVGMATESQARYLTAYENEKKHFDDWKSRIRNADEIKAEIKDIKDKKGSIEDDILELNMRKSAIIDYPESDERDRNLKIVNNDIELRQKLRDELAEKIALDEDELYNSIYYVYDDLRKNEDFAEKSKYDKTVKDVDYTYVNKDPLSQASRFVTGASARDKSTQYMTDDYEVPMYNYIYKTEGKKAAEKYIDFLQADINLRSRTAVEENARAFAKKHPVGSSITSILITPMKSVGAVMTALDYITKGEFDENSPYLSATHMSGAIRNEVSGKLGSVGGFAYDTAMSIADNLINMAAGGGNSAAVLALMGTEVFADSAVEAKDRGLSDGQAFALALTNAGIEVLTEKIGLDKLCEHFGEGKRAVTKFILENIGSEAGEEAVSGILDPLADIIIAGDKSEYNTTVREYMKSGLTKAEAQKKAFWQIAADVGLGTLGGAISGGVLGGGKAAIVSGVRTVAKEKAYHDFGKSLGKDELKTAEAQKMFIETGLESEKGSEAHKYAEKMQAKYNKNGKISLRSTEKLGVLSEITQMTETDERIASENESAKKETESLIDSSKDKSGNPTEVGNADRVTTVSDTIIHENSENSAKKSNRNKNVTADAAETIIPVGAKYSFSGYKDGKGVYEGNFEAGTPKSVKGERILRYIQDVWSKKPIELVIKDSDGKSRKIQAQFDPTFSSDTKTDASKLMGGNRHGSASERRVTLDLADDYYQIASESEYDYSKPETGKITETHNGVKTWHYFINDILFKEKGTSEEIPYRVSVNVKENGNGNFFYSFSAEKQTRTSTRQTLHADVSRPAESGSTNAYPLDNIISEKERKSTEWGNVNKKVTKDSPKTDNAKSESDVRSKAEAERLTKRYTTWTGIVHRYNNAEYERYRSASSITEKSAILANADAKTAELATKYSKAFGVPVVFFNENATESGINDGYYLGGTVFVNSQSKKPFVRLYAHELTHSIENTKSYSELSKYVFSALESKGKSRETLISEKTEEYKKISRGKVTLDSMTAENEIISEYVENNLLTDEEAIKDFLLSVEKPHSVFRAVKNLFNRLLSVIGHGNYKEMKFIEKMKQAYSSALSEMRKENAKVNGAFENAVYDGDFEDAGDNSDVRKEYSVSSDFYGACRDIENGTLDRSENPFISISSETPQILIDTAGAKNLPVIISYESLYLALRKSGELTGHYHGLGSESLSRITRSMNDPEMILRLANGRVNEIISVENDGKRYLVSVEFDAVKDFEGTEKTHNAYNLVLTIFEPKTNYIRNMLAKPENTVIYKKNSNTFSQVNPRLNELSGSINENNLSSDNSISQNSDLSTADGKKYSLSPAETEKKKSDYTYEALISKPDMKVTAIDDGKTYSTTAETRNNLKEAAIESVKRVGRVNENGNAVVFIDDIGEEVMVSKRSIAHGIDRRLENVAPVLENIGEILKNAIRINELNTRSENITESYILIGAARSNNNFYIANFVVNKYTGEVQDINVLYSANAKKEEPAAFLPKLTEKSATPTGSTISISQLLDFVNRNFKEILPEDVLRHYGHAVRPSGTFSKDIRYSLSPAEAEAKQEIRSALRGKLLDRVTSVERNASANLGRALGISYSAGKELFGGTFRSLTDEYLENGTISDETLEKAFDTTYEQAGEYAKAFSEKYSDIGKEIRETKFAVPVRDRESIENYSEILANSKDFTGLSEDGGKALKNFYGILNEKAPELFPRSLNSSPNKMLHKIYEVASAVSAAERTVKGLSEEGDNFKNLRKASFGASVNEFMSEMSKAKRYFDSKANEKSAEKQASEVSVSELGGIYKTLKEKEKVLRRAERNSLLTTDDSLIVGRLLRGETTLENIKNAENYAEIEAVYRAKAEYEEVNRQIKRYNAARRAKFSEEWGEILGDLGSWHDKKQGFLYARETLERNIDDIAPSRKIAKAMQEYAARPIHESEAKSTREKNAYRERVRKLGLSRKIARGNAVSESFAVQYIGEMRDNLRRIENSRGRLTQIDGMDYDGIKAELEKFRENNPNLDMAKIENAVKEFEDIYGELYDRINETLMRNGYSPISKKSGYFPHFMTDTPTDIMEKVCDLFGIKREVTPLPTSINGITDTFRPGKKFFPNLLERKSAITEYDAIKGFDSYIEGAEDVINQTDNIARMRALSREIRYLTGDEGTKARIEAVEANETLTEEEKQDEILNIKTKGKFDLANFVSYIDEYTNLLAGKKSKADRGTEYMLGRFMYNIAKWGESRVAANMVALNPASWLTNFVPITQGWSCVGTYDMLRGMYATFKNHFVTDGVREASAFLTNRKGSERLVKTRSEYISGKLSSPMEWIDNLTAGSVVRARLYYNMRAGLSFENALAEADDYAARVMADRSKGATPTVFNQANPFTKLFTQFQLEVNNQFSFIFKDIPINKKDKKIRLVTWAMLKLCVGAWLYNQLYELFVGRRCAFDPIDIIWDAIDTGLHAEKGKFYKGTLKFFENTVDEMPFIGGLLGGGRLPINSALPNVGNVFRAATDGSQNGRKRLSTIGKELIKPAAYLVPPFGGGQLKKLYEGYKAISEGGSYTVDKDGEDILQYPVYTDSTGEKVWNIAKVTLFGKSSLRSASNWVDKDFKNLSAKCTVAYRSMTEAGIKTHDAYDFLCELAKEQGKESIDRQIDIIKKSELATPAKTAAYFAFTSSKTDKDIMLKCEENGEDMGEVLDLLFDLRDSKLTHQKVADIIDADISDEAKENIFFEKVSDKEDENKPATIKNFKDNGLTFSDFLECYHEKLKLESEGYRGEEKAIMFKRFVVGKYPNADVSKIVNDEFPTDAGIYEKFMAAGLDDETSYKLHSEIKALKPRNGKNDVSTLQKIEAVTKSGIGVDEQLDALSVLAGASDYERFELAYSYGIKPADIAALKVRLENESVNQTAVKKEIDLLTGSGIVLASGAKKAILPEDKLHLTRKQKAVLWQLQNKSWKPDKNPYDVSVGREVYKLMQSDSKKSGKSTSDLPSTEKNYLPLPEKYK